MPTPFTVGPLGPLGADDATVSAAAYAADGPSALGATLIVAHGAGAPRTHPFITTVAEGLAARGVGVITFNFLYMERKRRVPDPAARLEACYRAVIAAARARMPAAHRLVAGGKSMGGRIATQVAADPGDQAVDGLVLLGYPLHPPGRPDRRRDAHLPAIRVPMLFVQGSRDTFGTPEELRPAVAACHRARLHVVEGGDHSFKLRGRGAPPPATVLDAVLTTVVAWLRTELLL